jgi:hypothetical protein
LDGVALKLALADPLQIVIKCRLKQEDI